MLMETKQRENDLLKALRAANHDQLLDALVVIAARLSAERGPRRDYNN